MLRSDLHGCASTSTLICVALLLGLARGQNIAPQSEQNAYHVAVHAKDIRARIKGLELFLKTYPGSTLKEGALENLANAYRHSGTVREEQEALKRLLTVNVDNLRGLSLKAELMFLRCDNADCEREETSLAEHGFRVLGSGINPDYVSDKEFRVQKVEAATVFHQVAGNAALKQHDYPTAQAHCLVLVKEDPNSFGYVYPLALAYLNADPPDIPKGLFYMARAAALAGVDDRKRLEDYGREQYEKYHGSTQGWLEVLRLAKATPQVPSGFTITAAR